MQGAAFGKTIVCFSVGRIAHISQIDRQKCIVITDRRTEQKRLMPIQLHCEAGNVPALGVKKSELRGAHGFNVAEAVEHSERIAVFEDSGSIVRQPR